MNQIGPGFGEPLRPVTPSRPPSLAALTDSTTTFSGDQVQLSPEAIQLAQASGSADLGSEPENTPHPTIELLG